MIKLRHIILEYNKDELVRIYAWLYFLTYPYKKEGMKKSSWEKDSRMGINFLDAIKYLISKKLVKTVSDKYIATSNAKAIVIKTFGIPKSREEAEKSKFKFKKYDTHSYSISNIPFEIYDHEEEKNIEKSKVTQKLKANDYEIIYKWYKKYQRQAHGWNTKLSKFVGQINDLIQNKKYILYRGININKNTNIKKNSSISDKAMSWTLSPFMAKRFALGNKHWMDNKTELEQDKMGIILKLELNPKDVFFDTQFINIKHPHFKGIVDWPDEFEVILPPKKEM